MLPFPLAGADASIRSSRPFCLLSAWLVSLARAGIKKPIRNKYMSTKGVDPKFLRNKRYALRGTKKALANARKFKKAE